MDEVVKRLRQRMPVESRDLTDEELLAITEGTTDRIMVDVDIAADKFLDGRKPPDLIKEVKFETVGAILTGTPHDSIDKLFLKTYWDTLNSVLSKYRLIPDMRLPEIYTRQLEQVKKAYNGT